jgi:hypothetical protein
MNFVHIFRRQFSFPKQLRSREHSTNFSAVQTSIALKALDHRAQFVFLACFDSDLVVGLGKVVFADSFLVFNSQCLEFNGIADTRHNGIVY